MSLKFLHLIWFLFIALFSPLSAQANLDQFFRDQDNAFLPVEEAFRFSGTVENNKAKISVQVRPGHYLYKHKFRFNPASKGIVTDKATYPTGEFIFDPYYNKNLETFSQDFTIDLPVDYSGTLPELEIGFQGCAKAGLCYPPHKIMIPLVASNTSSETSSKTPTSQVSSGLTFDDDYRKKLEESSLAIALLFFLLAGIGLSLTPCVLPMFPILSSLILGAKEQSKIRTFTLTLTYVLTMSVTFALAGTLMGLFGASLNLQAKLQSPWLLIPISILFVMLALSMFGLYEVQLPGRLRDKLSGNQQKSGSLSGAAIMGILSALVVSPCVSAPLAGALIYISSTGDALFGGLTLLALGLGMGIPLLALALGGRHWLPKSGQWMNGIRAFFGVLLLGVSIWMLERVIPEPLTLFLWGSLLIGCSVFLGTFNRNQETTHQKIKQVLGICCLIYGACLTVGAAMGNENPLRPLAIIGFQSSHTVNANNKTLVSGFITITSLHELDNLLIDAANKKRPVLVDLYADWCISCKIIERTVFPNPLIAEQISQLTLIKFDITENTTQHQQYLTQNDLFGPPAMLFFDADGEEMKQLKSQGKITAEQLHQKLASLLKTQQPLAKAGELVLRTESPDTRQRRVMVQF